MLVHKSDAVQSGSDVFSPCLLIDAHSIEPFVMKTYAGLCQALAGLCPVWLMVSDTPPDALSHIPPAQRTSVLILNNGEIFDGLHHGKGRKIYPGNQDLKLLAAHRRLEKHRYTHYIRMEYDVACISPLHETFERLCTWTARHDLGGSCLRVQTPENDKWRWWRTLESPPEPEGARGKCPMTPWAGFFPLLVVSHRFLTGYAEALRDGWRGHYETLMPTVAHLHGLLVGDLAAPPAPFTANSQFCTKDRKKLRFNIEPSIPFIHPVKSLDEIPDWGHRDQKPYLDLEHTTGQGVSYRQFQNDIQMSEDEFNVLKTLLLSAQCYLEFGAGGSTVLACALGVAQIVSVENDLEFIARLVNNRELKPFVQSGQLRLLHVRIGATGSWGRPVPPYLPHRWPLYWQIPWMKQPSMRPDLVLVDGRFRVACSAAAYPRLAPNGRLLIHDYPKRPEYHILERLFTLEKTVNSLAILRPLPDQCAQAEAILRSHTGDWR